MKLQDFVQRVLFTQEQTILDGFYPDDNIFKAVLLNANNVLEEFQDEAYWTFLRKKIVLGSTRKLNPGDHSIPEYELPDWVNRVSMLYQDRLTLHPYKHHHHCKCDNDISLSDINFRSFIEVPYQSRGAAMHKQNDWGKSVNLAPNYIEPLRALVLGKTITFNRPLTHHERNLAAVCDVQCEVPRMHICSNKCVGVNKDKPISYEPGDNYNPCKETEKEVLTWLPSPDYIILKTACYSADGSEIAQDLAMKLGDRAKSRLSKIRELDAAATDVDQLEYNPIEVFNI